MINFISPTIAQATRLGVSAYQDTNPIELRSNASETDVEMVIRAVYRQVLGNAHVMESERLVVPESQLKQGDIRVREFVREVAKSELYRSLFFYNCSRLRAIELNFKHLLGRAPESYEEILEKTHLLDEFGIAAEIDSYLDSEEYERVFGENIVPYYRGYKTQPGKNMAGYTHFFSLARGSASSDASYYNKSVSRLTKNLLADRPSAITLLPKITSYIAPIYRPTPPPKPFLSPQALREQARNEALQSRYQAFEEIPPLAVYPDTSEADLDVIIRATYRQVFGNAHIMESERLVVPESQFKRGELSVREFVRRIAKSELYRSRFFDNCSRYRSIELNFKHLLGRAPDDYSETKAKSKILDEEGFEAEIDSYLDSDEYQEIFGEDTVPFPRGYRSQTGGKLLGFLNSLQLQPSNSSSDKDNQFKVAEAIMGDIPFGERKPTDIKKLLAWVLRPQILPSLQILPTDTRSEDYQNLQRQCDEQAEVLETLQKQLSELLPFASLESSVTSTWETLAPSANTSFPAALGVTIAATNTRSASYDDLQALSEQQAIDITALREKIADARRLATVGNARLNKWRSRVFNG
ncbi:MAG: phycobilisome rod-core linker polypeptide [Cyanobacteria bacterium P01_E01_bin.42]